MSIPKDELYFALELERKNIINIINNHKYTNAGDDDDNNDDTSKGFVTGLMKNTNIQTKETSCWPLFQCIFLCHLHTL